MQDIKEVQEVVPEVRSHGLSMTNERIPCHNATNMLMYDVDNTNDITGDGYESNGTTVKGIMELFFYI